MALVDTPPARIVEGQLMPMPQWQPNEVLGTAHPLAIARKARVARRQHLFQ